jgi:AcrR family transcriptional regulator
MQSESDIPQNTRSRLLALAASRFRENGYSGTTTRELATELGMKNASLYYHINSKEDLLFAICVDAVEKLTTHVRAALEAVTELEKKIPAFVNAHVRGALDDRDQHATMLLELRLLPAERRHEVNVLRRGYIDMVRDMLAELQAAGEVRSDMTVRDMSLSMSNTLNWTVLWYQPGKGQSLDEVIAFLLQFIQAGVGAKPAASHG